MSEKPTIPQYELVPNERLSIEQFPELQTLADADGEAVNVIWNEKPYKISALERPYWKGDEVIFGMWDISDSDNPIPVAFADCLQIEDSAKISVANFRFDTPQGEGFPPEYKALYQLHGLETRGVVESNVGFAVDNNYKNEGLGQLLNAAVMVSMEARGVKEMLYDDDLTIKDNSEQGSHIQIKGTANDMKTMEEPSLYSKYATSAETTTETQISYGATYEKKSTIVSSHLSGVQQSILHEALGHYN